MTIESILDVGGAAATRAQAEKTNETDGKRDWTKEAEDLFLNLNTPRSEIYDFIKGRMTGEGKLDFAEQLIVQDLLQSRVQLMSFFSNMLKTLHEGAMAVISNLK